jgi:hypothetical protein
MPARSEVVGKEGGVVARRVIRLILVGERGRGYFSLDIFFYPLVIMIGGFSVG